MNFTDSVLKQCHRTYTYLLILWGSFSWSYLPEPCILTFGFCFFFVFFLCLYSSSFFFGNYFSLPCLKPLSASPQPPTSALSFQSSNHSLPLCSTCFSSHSAFTSSSIPIGKFPPLPQGNFPSALFCYPRFCTCPSGCSSFFPPPFDPQSVGNLQRTCISDPDIPHLQPSAPLHKDRATCN